MKLLITGGAGYIGSHVVRVATQMGHECVVVDNLSTGVESRLNCKLINLDLATPDATTRLVKIMNEERFDAVIHLAARKQVGESVQLPERYYLDNLGGLGALLLAMRESGLKKLVFSSSAATYGMPDVDSVTEDYPAKPINPYGETKLVGEWMVKNAKVWGLRGVNLRYFNVAGAGFKDLGDSAPLNLIPIAIQALKLGNAPKVFGSDYPTDDGSCVRDYVHVLDLAQAHISAVDYLSLDERPFDTFNVGTGVGASVFEVLKELKIASGTDFKEVVEPRRAGDPPKLVANVDRIREVMGFEATHNLKQIVQSAWDAS
ncbi:UDP-glucose 4-epimerase GalE [Candidatus Aquiluna sp. UB-MaderosW2red]|uniref:UDP-glucose 4-epimerase GalE n=1 Tax=Candidatus Aquiluna sp. UB-MaderosW2red TaxID=1855377 RepID=UPI000875D361|nr:UDP-glucose 4-epimerase GalE [Candidatus Aquiluna sp. UB-MaderosW2red]SCX07807.1 UDP-glucose 4-epimerase [Candidatus Aquiluna sp. UB-MaderosW2red]